MVESLLDADKDSRREDKWQINYGANEEHRGRRIPLIGFIFMTIMGNEERVTALFTVIFNLPFNGAARSVRMQILCPMYSDGPRLTR